MKLEPSSFQEIMSSRAGSSTIWYVLLRNGVGGGGFTAGVSNACSDGASAIAEVFAVRLEIELSRRCGWGRRFLVLLILPEVSKQPRGEKIRVRNELELFTEVSTSPLLKTRLQLYPLNFRRETSQFYTYFQNLRKRVQRQLNFFRVENDILLFSILEFSDREYLSRVKEFHYYQETIKKPQRRNKRVAME